MAPEDARRDEQLERSPSQGQLAKDRSIISRFFSAITDILLSSWMNVLLVFVPVGIAVRKFGILTSQALLLYLHLTKDRRS